MNLTHCPFCQSELQDMQPSPKWLRCPNSLKGNNHLFDYLCREDGSIHHYNYIIDTCKVFFWPPFPDKQFFSGKNYLMIRDIYDNLLYSGSINFDFADFNNLDKIKKNSNS